MSREPTRQSSFHCRKASREDGGKAGVGIELATVLAGTGRPDNCPCGGADRTGDLRLRCVLWDSLPLVAHADAVGDLSKLRISRCAQDGTET